METCPNCGFNLTGKKQAAQTNPLPIKDETMCGMVRCTNQATTLIRVSKRISIKLCDAHATRYEPVTSGV